jgi:predicted nucleic acid-binding protein
MGIVLDGSAALACCFKDEQTPATFRLLDYLGNYGAYVPAIWRLEFASSLRIGVIRGRLEPVARERLFLSFTAMNIVADPETDRYAWTTTHRLSEKYGLTPYDASYLELAQRMALPLATLDNHLQRAAKKAGVDLYPL